MKAKLQRSAAPVPGSARRSRETRAATARPGGHGLHLISGGLDAGTILRLQASAGNDAVGALLAQRAVECPPPPAPLLTPAPEDFPGFQTVAGRVGQDTRKLKAHPSARAKVAAADRAAAGPTNEVRSQGAAAQVDEMGRQKPGAFDKAAFVAAVRAAIDRATPKTMEEVDDFSTSGKPGQLKEQVVGEVGKGKDASAAGIKTASDATPDTSHGSPKPVAPMGQETPGSPPAAVPAEEAMPAPKPDDQVGLGYTKCTTDSQLEEANVTQEQVDQSNEPQFQDAMAAKQEADQHAETAPQQFRQEEQSALDQSKSEAGASAQAGLSEMHQVRGSALAHVGTHKDQEKGKNEAERSRVSTEIEAIYTGTKKDVDEILTGLDKKVGDAFNAGEADARQAFESYYKTKKDAYFDDRYSGVFGGARWLKDKLFSPPAEVNGFIDEAKQLYQSRMGQVVDQVATIVETELTRATQRIAGGRQQITDYVASQPKELRAAAQESATQISGRFDQLEQSVTEKGSSLVNDLAQKYVAAAKAVDDRCDAMREENKGLLEKAVDKVKGMIEAIGRLKDMLVSLAARVAGVIGDIIAHPIRFLENLIGAVEQGFGQFVDHIWTHLKKGLLTWLFGEVAKAGITLPDSFDLKGVLMFLGQVLGLTWDHIRTRAVNVLGAKVVGLIEKGSAVVQKAIDVYNVIRDEGIAGVWHLIQDKVEEIKDQVMDAVGGMVVDEVITAGVKWVIGLLNPASAFIKACMAIYDIVTFFMHHWDEITDVVNAVVDNLAAIVAGNIGAAAGLVEDALGRAIPVAIGFLASLLGLGDLGEDIKAILEKVREPVNLAIDWVLTNVIKPVIDAVEGGIESLFGKKGEEDTRSPEQRQADRDQGLDEATALLQNTQLSPEEVSARLPAIKEKYRLTELKVVTESQSEGEEVDHIEAAASPGKAGPSVKKPKDPVLEKARQDIRRLKEEAESDPEAVWRLLDVYAAQTDTILRTLARSDPVARQVIDERVMDRVPEIREDYRPPHEASAKVTGPTGQIVWNGQFISGGVTLALIQQHGWRRASQLTHTEVKAIAQAPLAAGTTLWIVGQYDPCSSCQGAMRAAAAGSGARINYWWPGGPPRGVFFG
jgi:Pput_2613-like deaminase